jgi:hypothetical protein
MARLGYSHDCDGCHRCVSSTKAKLAQLILANGTEVVWSLCPACIASIEQAAAAVGVTVGAVEF